jgi:FMN phosphatase YigB (HAD superfamily)
MGIRGVIFDLDGTLYRMPWYMKPALFAMLFPRMLRLPAYMKVREQFAGQDLGDRPALMRRLSGTLGERLGVSQRQALDWIEGPFYTGFVHVMTLVRNSRPGVRETLAGLRERGIKVAVLSDFGRVSDRLHNLEIDHGLLDRCYSCEHAGALKPNPRPFRQVAQEWSLPPEEILVVGDRDDTDGEGARKAGMQFMLLGRTQGLSWADARARLAAPM